MDETTYNWSNLKKLPSKTLKHLLKSEHISTLFQIQIQTVLGMRNFGVRWNPLTKNEE